MYIGIDIGGTTTRIAASTSIDSPLFINKKEFPTLQDFDSNYKKITDYINTINKPISAIGIGIAGRVNEATSTMIVTINLPQYLNVSLSKLLSDKYKCNVYVRNDGIASTLAEAFYTNSYDNFMYLTWGTGIAIISLIHNEKLNVLRLDRNIYFKNWEEEFSGNGIYKKYNKKAELLSSDEWDKIFILFIEKLEGFIHISKTKKIIFAGGVAVKQWNQLESRLLDLSKKMEVTFQLTKLSKDAGLYGAFAILKHINL